MDISRISLSEFLCDGNAQERSSSEQFSDLREVISKLSRTDTIDLQCGFSTEVIEGQPGNVVLVNEGEIVGLYFGDALSVSPLGNFRGRGLSVPLVLRAVISRSLPTIHIYTVAGRAALCKAWKVASGIDQSPWVIQVNQS